MDVPISLGVLLAFGMSVYETVQHGPHAYFDAAISLLFFLLIGRTLDHMMRERARQAVSSLVRLAARGAFVVQADGTQRDVVDARSPAGVVGYRCRGRLHRTRHRPPRREIEGALRGGSNDRAHG